MLHGVQALNLLFWADAQADRLLEDEEQQASRRSRPDAAGDHADELDDQLADPAAIQQSGHVVERGEDAHGQRAPHAGDQRTIASGLFVPCILRHGARTCAPRVM